MSTGKLHKNQCTPILNLMGPVLNKLFSMKGGFLGFNSHIYHQRLSLIIISFDKIPDIEQGYWCNNNCVTQMLKESWCSEWALWVPTPSRSVREWSTLQDFTWLYPGLKQLEIQWNLHYFQQKRWSWAENTFFGHMQQNILEKTCLYSQFLLKTNIFSCCKSHL